MKKIGVIGLLWGFCVISSWAQNLVYPTLKDLLAQKGDTVEKLRIEKRSRNQIVLSGGADYRVTVGDNDAMCRVLKKRCFAVSNEKGDLFINCRKLRYRKMRFGNWYAPAVVVGKSVFFSAVPLGSVVGGKFIGDDDVKLGGKVGDALATSSLVSKRVCYELNGETGKIEFVDRNRMLQLLEPHPEWKESYLKEGGQEARHTFKYLLKLSRYK